MSDNARKYIDIVPAAQDLPTSEPPRREKRPWKQQEGEKTLWYNRLQIYIALGPKRSLVAAVAKEREKVQDVKSRKEAPIDQPAPSDASHANSKKNLQIVRPSVPGSWNDACKEWRWVERARAYDAHLIQKSLDDYIQGIYTGLACKEHRVWELNKMAVDLMQGMKRSTSGQEQAIMAGRVQSIMRQIEEEMKTFDKQVANYVLTPQLRKMYRESFSDGQESISAIVLDRLEEDRRHPR